METAEWLENAPQYYVLPYDDLFTANHLRVNTTDDLAIILTVDVQEYKYEAPAASTWVNDGVIYNTGFDEDNTDPLALQNFE